MEQTQRATVVMMRGTGEQRLQKAIMQGLVQEDLANDVKAVLQRSEEWQAENAYLTAQYNQVQNELNAYKANYRDAVQAHQREMQRKKRWDDAKAFAVLAILVFAMVFASELITRLILH